MNSYAVELLKGLCQIYSPSYNEREAVEFMVRQASAKQMRSYIDGAGNFVAEKGTGGRTLLFLGHIDTVPGVIPVKVENGILYGRGSVDAKGPLAAFFVAASELGTLDDLRIIIVGAVEEEAPTSKGARFLLDKYKPDYVIVGEPSGAGAVTLGYKGRLNLRYEFTKDHEHTAAGGRGVGSFGVKVWNKVEAYCENFNQGKGAFESVDPYLMSMNTSTNGLTDKVEMRISFRMPLGMPIETFKAELGRMADSNVPLEFYGIEHPFKAEKKNVLVRAFLNAIRSKGLDPKFKVKTGTADMNIVGPVWKCPILAYGPGDSKLDHTPLERIVIDEYHQSISILTKVIKNLDRAKDQKAPLPSFFTG